jgi:uncharacterized protein
MADNRCDYCGKYEMLPFNCKYCGGTYCSSHRLPEYHECLGLRAMKEGGRRPSVQGKRAPQAPARKRLRMPRIRLPGQGLYTYAIIIVCIIVFVLQMALPSWFTNALALDRSSILAGPWTLVTYMFVHASVVHVLLNMLVLFFFGRLLERQIGSTRYLGLYLGSGILAGLAQVLLFPSIPVVGASGAIMGVMGTLTVLMPDLTVLVYFIFPLKLVYMTILYAAFDIIFLGSGDMIAHGAHLVGLAAGLAYGYVVKKSLGTVHAYGRV